MNIIGVQLILFFFVIFMVYVLFTHWRKNEVSLLTFCSWLLIWLVFLLLVIFPKIFENSVVNLFFLRLMDFITVIAFMILTYFSIKNHIEAKKCEKRLDILVRKIALQEK